MVAYEVASQHGISQVHLNEVAMICISYLDISGSPSHLRYLIRLLKQKAPGVPIFVGLWPAEDSALKDVQLQCTSTIRRTTMSSFSELFHSAQDASLSL